MRIEHRTLGLALLGRPNVTLRSLQPTPAPHRRYPDRKARRRLTRRHLFFEHRHNALPQIQAVRLSHRSLQVTDESNHSSLFLGIPSDSLFGENALAVVRFHLGLRLLCPKGPMAGSRVQIDDRHKL